MTNRARSLLALTLLLMSTTLWACGGTPPGAAGGSELAEQVARGLSGPEAELPAGLVATDAELSAALAHAALAGEAAERVRLAIADGVTETRATLKAAAVSLAAADIGRFEMRRSNEDPAEIKAYTIQAELVVGEAHHDLTLPAIEGARGWALAGPPTLRLEAPGATAARTLLKHGQAAFELVAEHANAPDEAATQLEAYLAKHGAEVDQARATLAAVVGDDRSVAMSQLSGRLGQLAAFAQARDRLKDSPALQDPRVTTLLDRFRAGPIPR